jgi:hypothetical protein
MRCKNSAKLLEIVMQKQNENYRPRIALVLLWIATGICGRLFPHLPNVTPMTSLSLFAGSKLPKGLRLITILGALFISDLALSYLYGYPILSYWSLFAYSGFAFITLFGSHLSMQPQVKKLLPCILGSGLFFWLWTNFGVWLTSAIYAKSFSGLVACYIAALPFLRNALIGDLIWGGVIFGSFAFVSMKYETRQNSFLKEDTN